MPGIIVSSQGNPPHPAKEGSRKTSKCQAKDGLAIPTRSALTPRSLERFGFIRMLQARICKTPGPLQVSRLLDACGAMWWVPTLCAYSMLLEPKLNPQEKAREERVRSSQLFNVSISKPQMPSLEPGVPCKNETHNILSEPNT